MFETGYPFVEFKNFWTCIFCYFLIEGLGPNYKRNFVEFSVEFLVLENFLKKLDN